MIAVADRYTPPAGFVSMAQAQEMLGVSKRTLQKRVADRGLRVYEDGRDTRVRLLRIEDVEAIAALRQVDDGAE